MAKKKFSQIWTNQTSLGKIFGLSARELGNELVKHNLKDPKTGSATTLALDQHYAKSTPLKNGANFYMWNKQKVMALLKQSLQPLSKIDYWANHVQKIFMEAENLAKDGQDKLASFLADDAFEEVPKDILSQVQAKLQQTDHPPQL